MNSKIGSSTEDEMAYKFFESLENLYNSINITIKKALVAIDEINDVTFYTAITGIDKDIPNIGITLNNKLVEIYQQFKEKNIKVFASENKGKKTVSMSILPSIVFIYLINSTSQIAHDELENFFNRYEEISVQKDSNMTKITKSRFSKDFENFLMNYNLNEDIAESILYYFELNGYTIDEINYLMKTGIEEDLEKLGLQNKIAYIRERIKEGFQESGLKSWEFTEEETRHIQEETAKIAMESLKAQNQEINAEHVK